MFTEKIVSRQVFFIFFIIRTTILISILPVLTTAEALQDAWLAALISFFSSAAIVVIIVKLSVAFPVKSLVEYSQELLGSIPGKLVSFFYLWLFLFMAATDLRIYAEVLKTSFFPKTPLVVIMAFMVFLSVLSVYSGLEPIGRSADIIFPLFLFMILGSLLFPLIHADFSNLQPVMARGWTPVLLAAVAPTFIAAQYANLTIITPSLDEPRKALKASLWSLAAAGAVLVSFAVVVVAVLGPDEGLRSIFPVFKMIRATRVSEFLERVEALTIFAWGLGLYLALSVNLYSGSKGLSQVFGLPDNRALILPMAVVWVVFSFQGYGSMFEIMRLFDPTFSAPFFFFVLLFPQAVLWAAFLLKKTWKKQLQEKTAEEE